MLSILIPIYNYNVFPLAKMLQAQCSRLAIAYEIICLDDASQKFVVENSEINSLENCTLTKNPGNLGRARSLNAVAAKANYDWILFLDCDVMPVSDQFIQNYLNAIGPDPVVFGGIAYKDQKPGPNEMLRWVYGREREAILVEKRKLRPYESTLTSNILLQKSFFDSILFDDNLRKYGYEDLVFIHKIKTRSVAIQHIDNPAYHLNLEFSADFIVKTRLAMENLKFILDEKILDINESAHARAWYKLSRFGGDKIVALFFKTFRPWAEKNLTSAKPSLFVYDCYKLGYFCYIKQQ